MTLHWGTEHSLKYSAKLLIIFLEEKQNKKGSSGHTARRGPSVVEESVLLVVGGPARGQRVDLLAGGRGVHCLLVTSYIRQVDRNDPRIASCAPKGTPGRRIHGGRGTESLWEKSVGGHGGRGLSPPKAVGFSFPPEPSNWDSVLLE